MIDLTEDEKQRIERIQQRIKMLEKSDKHSKCHVVQQQIKRLKSRIELIKVWG